MRPLTLRTMRLPIFRTSLQPRMNPHSTSLHRPALLHQTQSKIFAPTRIQTRRIHDQVHPNTQITPYKNEDQPIYKLFRIFMIANIVILLGIHYLGHRKADLVEQAKVSAAQEIGYLKGRVAELEKQLQTAERAGLVNGAA
jgi:hypothetical protein